MKVKDAYYTDRSRKVVIALWEDDNKKVKEEVIIAQSGQSDWENLLSQSNVTLDWIDERTVNRNRELRSDFEKTIIDIAKRDGLWDDITTGGKYDEEKLCELAELMLLDSAETDNTSLSKLQLKLFEKDLVKNSSDDTKKAALRAATTFNDAIIAFTKFKT